MDKKTITKYILYFLVLILLCLFLFPLYWAFICSLQPEQEIIKWPPNLIPHQLTIENYKELFIHPEDTPVLKWFFNSAFAACAFSFLSVLITSLAAPAAAASPMPHVYANRLRTSRPEACSLTHRRAARKSRNRPGSRPGRTRIS